MAIKLCVWTNGFSDVVRIDQPAGRSILHARHVTFAAIFQCRQRAQDGVVIDMSVRWRESRVGGENALDGEIERVAAIEREDEMFRPLAVEEAIQPLAALIDELAVCNAS